MMLLCPVCGKELHKTERTWRCDANHCFDEARQGYVNLLTVDRKHAKHPGDTKEQVAARKAFLDADFYAPIAEKVCEMTVPLSPKAVLDAGCGEGYYLTQLQNQLPDTDSSPTSTLGLPMALPGKVRSSAKQRMFLSSS